jgi:DNA-directed RNA polymerase specialized sigma24 family protein
LLLFEMYDFVRDLVERNLPASLRTVIDVDDIIQETFIRAIADIRSLRIRTRKGFARWLQAIAVNQLTDIMLAEKRIKRGNRRRVVLKGSRKKHRSSIRDPSQRFVDLQDTPARALRRDERIRAVQVEIASLRERRPGNSGR